MDKEKITYSRTIVLTPAQVKALNTPVQVVAAPGAGKVLEVIKAIVTVDFNTTAYTLSGSDHTLAIGDATYASSANIVAHIQASSRTTRVVRPVANDVALAENTAISVTLAGTGQPAAGDSNILVEVFYQEHDVTGDND